MTNPPNRPAAAFRSVTGPIFRDKAVLYAVSNGIWGIAAGFVTVPLVLYFFTPELQGYMYTFQSLLGLQSLFVLGFGQVLQQCVGHEWTRISQDGAGNPLDGTPAAARLADLRNFALRWYAGIGVASVFGLGIGGYLFITTGIPDGGGPAFAWRAPWLVLAAVTGVQLFISPGPVFLEAVNRVRDSQRIKLQAGILERIVFWITLASGFKLWIFAGSRLVACAAVTAALIRRHRSFFRSLFALNSTHTLSWRADILPLQWRYAVNTAAGFINFSLLNPILFAVQGAEIAGRMGLTWSVYQMIWGLSFTMVSTKMPAMAMAAARGDSRTLEFVYGTALRRSTLALFTGIFAVVITVMTVTALDLPIAARILPPLPTLLLAPAMILHHLRNVMMVHIRSQKKEPFWVLSIVEIALGITVLPTAGVYGGAVGLCAAFAIISALQAGAARLIFNRYRKPDPVPP